MNNYKVCVYCKWFDTENSVCTNEKNFETTDNSIDGYVEDGYLSEAIDEVISNHKKSLKNIKTLLENSLSKKTAKSITERLTEYLEDDDWETKEALDEVIHRSLKAYNFDKSVQIKNPDDLCCNNFM